jgi:hypothetical protein
MKGHVLPLKKSFGKAANNIVALCFLWKDNIAEIDVDNGGHVLGHVLGN